MLPDGCLNGRGITGRMSGSISRRTRRSRTGSASTAQPAFAPVFNLIAGMTFYSPKPERMRRPTPIGPGKALYRDGSNAADVLARLEREKPMILSRVRDYLQSFNPEFRDVTVTETTSHRWLAFSPSTNPSNWKLNSSEPNATSAGRSPVNAGVLAALWEIDLPTRRK